MGVVQVLGVHVVLIIEARLPPHVEAVRRLLEEYAGELARTLAIDLGFQDFDAELERLATDYGPPAGCLLLAMEHDRPMGCGALRRLGEGVCEMKRLFVTDAARGAGIGRLIAEELVGRGRALGYARMRLDSLASMTAARQLYRGLGFRPIEPYYFNPLPGGIFMEMALREPSLHA